MRWTHLLRLIGIFLFLWILSRIDRTQFIQYIKNADARFLVAGLLWPFVIYAAKTFRWHLLIKSTGMKTTLAHSWRLYNIGIFFAVITPGKLGEFGRAAYLKRAGMHGATAICLTLIDRIADIIAIAVIAVMATGILFGKDWALLCAVGFLTVSSAALLIFKRVRIKRDPLPWLEFLKILKQPHMLSMLAAITLAGWVLHFVWTLLIAWSIGITTPAIVLISVFTLTGIISLLPIAPSGLGTREATLIALLAPYGIAAEQATTLGFLMFASITFSGVLGAWYFLKNRTLRKEELH